MGAFLRAELLSATGASHGFGVRGVPAPAGLHRPAQVHGREVVVLREAPLAALGEADAVASAVPGLRIGVVTADCVPLLLAAEDGSAVAAVHAGWRGLAEGVVAAGVAALSALGPAPAAIRCALGPHIGVCCYEVDDPVTAALHARFGAALGAARVRVREGHWLVDLGALVRVELLRAGLLPGAVDTLPDACTRCDSRFESFRRDGRRAGRLVHWIAARGHHTLDTPAGGP
jgi:polyphenol oxidase